MKAADKDSSSAQTWIGYLYLYGGNGIDKDYAQAMKWLKMAVDQGNESAMYHLAGMYKDGLGTEKDINAAAELYLKSAELGYTYSEEMLNDPEIAAAAAISAGNG